jgi:RNase P subunit RPR2
MRHPSGSVRHDGPPCKRCGRPVVRYVNHKAGINYSLNRYCEKCEAEVRFDRTSA